MGQAGRSLGLHGRKYSRGDPTTSCKTTPQNRGGLPWPRAPAQHLLLDLAALPHRCQPSAHHRGPALQSRRKAHPAQGPPAQAALLSTGRGDRRGRWGEPQQAAAIAQDSCSPSRPEVRGPQLEEPCWSPCGFRGDLKEMRGEVRSPQTPVAVPMGSPRSSRPPDPAGVARCFCCSLSHTIGHRPQDLESRPSRPSGGSIIHTPSLNAP